MREDTLESWRGGRRSEKVLPSIRKADAMKLRKQHQAPPPPPQETAKSNKPPWQEFLDPMERPNREDLGAEFKAYLAELAGREKLT